MAAAISGRDRAPLFTTGPATRHALAAAGALGATTGTVVHLPSAPAAPVMSAVLAHELMHTRSPVRRPRFFLGGAGGLLDDDERGALDAGRQVASNGQAAGIVGGLPVGGGIGAVGDVATRAAKAAVLEAGSFGGMGAFTGAGTGTVGTQSAEVAHLASATTGDHGAGAQHLGSQLAGGQHAGGAPDGMPGGAVAPGGAAAGVDADQIVELVEARLLREIERRGGRWAGMF